MSMYFACMGNASWCSKKTIVQHDKWLSWEKGVIIWEVSVCVRVEYEGSSFLSPSQQVSEKKDEKIDKTKV